MHDPDQNKTAPLIPVDERLVDFYGDPIVVPLAPLNERIIIYVRLRLLCEHMSISWSGQRERVNRDPVLSKAHAGCTCNTYTRSGWRHSGDGMHSFGIFVGLVVWYQLGEFLTQGRKNAGGAKRILELTQRA